MKKVIACISLIFAMSAGVTALAADYNETDTTVTVGDSGYKTILITPTNDTRNIVYVNQNDSASGFNAATKFYIKANAPVGDYTVTKGNGTATTTETFSISSGESEEVLKPLTITNKVFDADGQHYGVGIIANVKGTEAQSIVLKRKSDDKKVSYDTGLSGEMEVKIAVKVTDIPANEEVTVYVSNK